MNSLAERLRLLRAKLGHSATEMADRVQMRDRKSWERYERGENSPKADVLTALVDMGVDADWLLSGRGRMFTDESASGSIPIIGLAECGIAGWMAQNPLPLRVILAEPPPRDAFAFIAVGSSMDPAGIPAGSLATASPSAPLQEGKPVIAFTDKGLASIKNYGGRKDGWTLLQGWVDGESYTDRRKDVVRLAAVIDVVPPGGPAATAVAAEPSLPLQAVEIAAFEVMEWMEANDLEMNSVAVGRLVKNLAAALVEDGCAAGEMNVKAAEILNKSLKMMR